MIRLVWIAVIPVLVSARCCLPKQWHGMLFMDYGTKAQNEDTGHRMEISQGIVVDSTTKMIAVDQTFNIDNTGEKKQKVIQNYNTGKQYVILNGTCTEMNVTISEPFCLPSDAEIVIHSFIGAGSSKLPTTKYKFMDKSTTVFMTVADNGCVPILYESQGITDGVAFKVAAEYLGITVGPVGRDVFNLPASCKS